MKLLPGVGASHMENSTGKNSDAERRDSEFLALLGKHEIQLTACVHALVPSWHDAEDIIQETRLRLWREYGKFRSGSDFSAWACTIARYVVHTHVKQSRRKPLLLSSNLGDTIIVELIGMPEQADRRLRILAECVRKLGSEALELLRRCYIEREKIKDIAAELGRSLAGTYQALSRARRELFNCMQDRLHREESP
jgi:RNA polymerase sigma-70 factor, ECF subfamily